MSKAEQLVDAFAQDHPLAAELALYASLAVRVEPALLRVLRLELLPAAAAQDEADVWFSRLVRARGPDGIALREDVLEVLRDRLAKRWRGRSARARVERAWAIVDAAHAGSSPALRLEERISWLAISDAGDDSIERELNRVLRAVEAGARPNLARWAANAWPRLPASARATRAGWLLGQVAHGVRQDRVKLAVAPSGAGDVDLSLLVSPQARVPLGVRRDGSVLELGAVAGRGAVAIEVLDTEPRLVDVVRDSGEGQSRETVAIAAGAVVRVEVGEGAVRLITAARDIYELAPATAAPDILMLIETAPAELARSLVNSRAFVTDTARDFTGRAATIAALDEALSDPAFPSGYVVISGEPGVGKTALLCHLVERRGYVHHFTGQAEGTTSPELAVRNLCAQLMLRYDLPGPPSSDLLSQLNEATARARGEPVVILVDALDEAAPAYALYSNPLDLPATLPSGAFIVVTTRSPHQPELTVEQRRDIQLDSSRDDIREYVRRRLPPGVAPRDPESVASLIAELSDGSFLYARYAVDDLIAGRPEREVPWALSALVDDVLSRLRGDDPERFATRYEPLLRSLAYASKPLEYSELAARAGLDPPDVAAAIRALRPLFNEVGERDHIAVSLSHWTLRQYLIEALESHRDLGSPILVAAESAEGLREIGALVGPLTNAEPRREILLVGVVRPPRASRPWRRDPAQEDLRAATSERLDRARSDLIHLGVRCRSVVLEPDEEGRDLARLAVDEAAAFLVLQGRPPSRSDRGSWVAAALRDAPCDVAMLSGRAGVELLTKSSSVIVPFGGAEHDWAALELASSLCAATGASLKLLGAAGAGDEGRSVTRLLADAGLLVQQATGVATEPILVSGGRDGMISAMAGAALVCIGLSDRWEKEGLGSTRAAIADAAPVPILFIRRGNRPGMFAPAGGATQFTWAAVPRPAKPGRGSARS